MYGMRNRRRYGDDCAVFMRCVLAQLFLLSVFLSFSFLFVCSMLVVASWYGSHPCIKLCLGKGRRGSVAPASGWYPPRDRGFSPGPRFVARSFARELLLCRRLCGSCLPSCLEARSSLCGSVGQLLEDLHAVHRTLKLLGFAFFVTFVLAVIMPEGLAGSSAWLLALPLLGTPANTVREMLLTARAFSREERRPTTSSARTRMRSQPFSSEARAKNGRPHWQGWRGRRTTPRAAWSKAKGKGKQGSWRNAQLWWRRCGFLVQQGVLSLVGRLKSVLLTPSQLPSANWREGTAEAGSSGAHSFAGDFSSLRG